MPFDAKIADAENKIASMRATIARIANNTRGDGLTDRQIQAIANLEHSVARQQEGIGKLQRKKLIDQERRYGANFYVQQRLIDATSPILATGGIATEKERAFLVSIQKQESPVTEKQQRAAMRVLKRIERKAGG